MNIKFKLLFIALGMLIFSSCIKDEITRTKATLYNNTDHPIMIWFYHNGMVSASDTIHLAPNSNYLFAEGSKRGNYQAPGFTPDLPLDQKDSIIVVFDNINFVSHYGVLPDSINIKHYLASSKRNLRNPESYEFSRKKGKKGVYTNIHNYYFTEADYEYAKD